MRPLKTIHKLEATTCSKAITVCTPTIKQQMLHSTIYGYWPLRIRPTWFVTTRPATVAEVSVAVMPEMRADTARRETWPAREGASWPRIPIWIPSEPMLPKPQTA